MEKILIKPNVKEIVLRGKPEDGHVDVFSYNYEGSNTANGLGGLFIVGQVQPASEDTSYMINLIASLAKREYYADPGAAPKESFSKTLKKINEVLQDFFRNKETKVNIGIFAVVGENILISRLGKFKIILGRNGENIDILNNINLFNKEHIQEKEFSNVISGKIMPQDKIFAFYPARTIISREKNIKADFLKLDSKEFAEKMDSIKKTNEGFLCAGIHMIIEKHTEPAIVTTPQPQELKTVLAKSARTPRTKQAVPAIQDLPSVRPVEKEPEQVSSIKIEPAPGNPTPPQAEPEITKEEVNKSNVYYPNNKGLSGDFLPNPEPQEEASPLIRPSEFSSAKKDNFLSVMLRKYKPSGIYVIGREQPIITKKRMITAISIILLIGAGSILAKFTFIPSLPVPGIENARDKTVNALLEQASSGLQAAQGFKDQNNLLEARKTLLESLSAITASNLQDPDLIKAKSEAMALLDQIDKAIDASPSLLYQLSQEVGNGMLLTLSKDKILVYASDPKETDSGAVLTATESGIEDTKRISKFNPLFFIGGEQLVVMISKLADQIASYTLKDGGLKSSSLALSGSTVSAYPYQDNLYVLTTDSIYKIADAAQGKSTPVKWLSDSATLPINPLLMAVDSKIYVLSRNGILATYYKGSKESEVNTSIPVNEDSLLLTVPDSSNLYLVDKETGRIYVLDRTSGTLSKTVKVNSDQALVSATMAENGTIYLLTADNKVWKVNP